MNSHHNSTNEQFPARQKFESAAVAQEDKIFDFFKQNPLKGFTASDIWEKTGMEEDGSPITSTRRAMTNLLNAGKLRKTTAKKDGRYGRPEYFYTLADAEIINSVIETKGQSLETKVIPLL
ncbi:MAG TPA: hypothetical protein VI757_03860 [Bacteroidia bacterium]|nr:hypothetical protein [Bacteroidia bacterium]